MAFISAVTSEEDKAGWQWIDHNKTFLSSFKTARNDCFNTYCWCTECICPKSCVSSIPVTVCIHTLCHSLPTPSISQVYLATEELGNSLDEVDALMKKHETVEKLLETQEQKVGDVSLSCVSFISA